MQNAPQTEIKGPKQFRHIWRVENQHGCGPYRGRGNINDALVRLRQQDYKIREKRWPLPHNDSKLSTHFEYGVVPEQYLFAFANIEQYQRWFFTARMRQVLHEGGFFMTRYRLPDYKVIEGASQVAFERNAADITGFRSCADGKSLHSGNNEAVAAFTAKAPELVQRIRLKNFVIAG